MYANTCAVIVAYDKHFKTRTIKIDFNNRKYDCYKSNDHTYVFNVNAYKVTSLKKELLSFEHFYVKK